MRLGMQVVVLAVCALPVSPGHADQPLLRPSRDVDVTYRAAATPGGTVLEQRVRWLAAVQIMRIDPPVPGLHVIIDYVARRMSVVRDTTRSVVEMAAPDGAVGTMSDNVARSVVRRGEATVAGRACTEWQMPDRNAHPVLVCITDDGVLLRAGTPDQVRVSAVSVQYAPQDSALFRVPKDYVRQAPEAAR
jgi:hypothetical protein